MASLTQTYDIKDNNEYPLGLVKGKAFSRSKKMTMKNIDKKIILLIHGPPYGTKLDKLAGQYSGNKDITDFVKKNKVDYVICGHLHENFGKKDKIGQAIVLNPGPYGKIIKL